MCIFFFSILQHCLTYTFQQLIYSFIIPALLHNTEAAEIIQYQQVYDASVMILITAVNST